MKDCSNQERDVAVLTKPGNPRQTFVPFMLELHEMSSVIARSITARKQIRLWVRWTIKQGRWARCKGYFSEMHTKVLYIGTTNESK